MCIHFIFILSYKCRVMLLRRCTGGEREGARERDLRIHDTSSKVEYSTKLVKRLESFWSSIRMLA